MSETPIENTAAEIIALLKETIRPDLQALDAELLALRAQLAQREQELTAARAAAKSQAWRMAEQAEGLALNLHARHRMAQERDAALAALQTVSTAILPDAAKRATWDAAALASLATAHRGDSAWMDECYEAKEAELTAARAALGRLREVTQDMLQRISGGRLGSIGSIANTYLPQIGVDEVARWLEQLAGVADPVPVAQE